MNGDNKTLPRQERWDPDSMLKEIESLELPYDDGEPLESDWHRIEMNLLIDSVKCHRGERTDYYVGGNMFIHFSQERTRKRDFRGPDFFFAEGRPLLPIRKYWSVWEEDGKYPDAIIELLSPTTEKNDRTVKFTTYEQTFRTKNYYIFDPYENILDGYQLGPSVRYVPLEPNEHGRLWCEPLGLWLGLWYGRYQKFETTWLRFFTPDGKLVLVGEEIERERAKAEFERAEAERRRAEAAEAELARLRALLGQQGPPS